MYKYIKIKTGRPFLFDIELQLCFLELNIATLITLLYPKNTDGFNLMYRKSYWLMSHHTERFILQNTIFNQVVLNIFSLFNI